MKPGRDAAQRWLRQAEHDLRITRGHHERADYSDACFMAEQAAQKALKAFLMWQGHRSVPLLSVAKLAERCAQSAPVFAASFPAGLILNKYYPPPPPPDPLPPPAVPFESYTQEQGAGAVAAVQAL